MVNLQTRGADMSGGSSSAAAWAAALADLPNNSGEIYAPPGIVAGAPFDSPAQGTGFLTIRGAGRGATTFQGAGVIDHVLQLRMPGEVCDLRVDGGGAMTNGAVLYLTTSAGIPISSIAARRVDVGNSGVNGFWTLAVWDEGQTFAIDRCWLDNVYLYGPTKPSLDGATIAYVNQAFIKNMVTDGISRPNWFVCHHLEVDGYRGVHANAAAPSNAIFDMGIDHLQISHMYMDLSAAVSMQLNCCDAHISLSRFDGPINGPFASTSPPPRWSFHQVECLQGIQLQGAVEIIEIVGGAWGSAPPAGGFGSPFMDLAPNGTAHGIFRVSHATLAYPNVYFAFNASTSVAELAVSDNSFSNPGRTLSDVTLINGSPTLTSPTGLFTAADVGRTVRDTSPNIGLGFIPVATTISAFVDATHVTMSANATGTTVAGTPDTVALGSLAVTPNKPPWNGNVVPGILSRIRGNGKLNPIGVEVVAVPATGVAVAAVQWDRTYYVTANAAAACTMTIQNGPAVVIPAAAMAPVRVPAGKTVTPTFAGGNAPTWVVEGE